MPVSRLRDIPGIGVDQVGAAADALADPDLLRLENLDTDLRPPRVALELTRAAVDEDPANSYLPAVLRTKRGLPITLVLIYKCVAEGVGLVVRGINSPGHFLAAVKTDAPDPAAAAK